MAGRDALIKKISGFNPAHTGTICDNCNSRMSEGDEVSVLAVQRQTPNSTTGPEWVLTRTRCSECEPFKLGDSDGAVVKCEIGYSSTTEHRPLHNPEIIEFQV